MIWKLFKDGELVNTIVSDEAFALRYAEEMGYTAELVGEAPAPEPDETEPTVEELIDIMLGVTSDE